VSALSALLLAEDGAVSSRSPADISTIVIGFTGGFVRHDNPYHGPVRLAKRIQNNLPHGTYVRVFENRHRKSAYNAILRLLDRDHDGVLTGEEKAQAHIVLFGHSWGASAVVLLARELDRIGIPVLLTVQVDSVAKLWQSDGIIPDNVAAAVNFYQPHGFIHGRSLIRAADTSKTQILGNYRYDYNQAPVKCEGTSWFDRAFMASHIESECDPHLWSRVEDLVRQRLQPELGFVAAVPQP
jgi:pimeloyl-ACP methyl ester carboxylesterase